MKTDVLPTGLSWSVAPAEQVERVVLRLVKDGPERRAIEANEIDAIIDPESRTALLLPAAQRALLERAAHLREREQAQAPSIDPGLLPRAVLDSLPFDVAVLDAAGVVVSTNQGWRDFAASHNCLGAHACEGASFLAGCDAAAGDERVDGIAIAAGIRQVIAGERRRFDYHYACADAGRRLWLSLSVAAIAGDRAGRTVISREDVTERRRGEMLVALECTVAHILADGGSTGTALRAVIRTVCEAKGWDCGRYFSLDAASGSLRLAESWGVAAPAVASFLEKSRGMELRIGAGLKGRVFQSGEPLWVRDGARDAAVRATALAPETDIDGAFIFPVATATGTIGVLAFSGRAIVEPDDRTLRVVHSIGGLLGRFLQRQQAADSMRRSEARFRRLVELSNDWYWEQDRNFRFTLLEGCCLPGVDDYLGKTHWELPRVIVDDDTWAAHRSQLGEQWSFCDFEFAAAHPDGGLGYYSISGEPVYDEAGAFTGYWGTGNDITARKRAEIALRDSAARLRAGLTAPE